MTVELGQTFKAFVPLTITKASDRNDEKRYLEGVFTTEHPDLEGEIVSADGAIADYLMAAGYINWNHGKTPDDIIGEPVSVKACTYNNEKGQKIKALIYKGRDKADGAWKLHHDLIANGSNRRLGWSIEGTSVKKAGSKIIHTVLTNVALTPQPINPNTWAEVAKSILASTNYQERQMEKQAQEAEKALTTQLAAPLIPQSLEGDRDHYKDEEEKRKKRRKEMGYNRALHYAKKSMGLNDQMAEAVVMRACYNKLLEEE